MEVSGPATPEGPNSGCKIDTAPILLSARNRARFPFTIIYKEKEKGEEEEKGKGKGKGKEKQIHSFRKVGASFVSRLSNFVALLETGTRTPLELAKTQPSTLGYEVLSHSHTHSLSLILTLDSVHPSFFITKTSKFHLAEDP